MIVPRYARGRVAADVDVGIFQGIDKTECSLLGLLTKVIADSVFYVLIGKSPKK